MGSGNNTKNEVDVLMISLMMMMMMILSGRVSGDVYKVGDSSGWTSIANVDYSQWALTKTFQLGDIIVFEYNPQFHNVVRVTHTDYRACNASSPIFVHVTGNDSITITDHGHHFFICAVPSHCHAGQKVDINVARAPSVATGSSRSLPSPGPKTAATVPAPSPSNAATLPIHNAVVTKFDSWLLLLLMVYLNFL